MRILIERLTSLHNTNLVCLIIPEQKADGNQDEFRVNNIEFGPVLKKNNANGSTSFEIITYEK